MRQMHKRPVVVLASLGLCLLLAASAEAGLTSKLFISYDIDGDATPAEARNLRAAARFHFQRASKAQNEMFKAENDDDVDGYEKYLEIMREEDPKWMAKMAEYDQVRDILESKIRTNELTIEGFTPRYEKGAVASILDHLTGKART